MPTAFTADFWKKARNLFEGAQLFAKHGLTHRDIKPANILLNPKSSKIIYIDFGLSRNVKELTNDILDGTKKTAFHWSYPFEYGLVSQVKKIIKMNDAEADAFYKKTLKQVVNDILTDAHKNVKTMLALLDDRMFPMNDARIESMIYDAIDSMRHFKSAEECVGTMVKSIDMFSLGLTMNMVLNAFYDVGKVTAAFYTKMRTLIAKMTSFNMKERLQDYDEASTLYDKMIVKGTTKTRKQ
jgi:serine/threonine protein kinase